MSDDKNFNNDSEAMFEESRRKKVENFKMNIEPSFSPDLVEDIRSVSEAEGKVSDFGVETNKNYDLDNFSYEPAEARHYENNSRQYIGNDYNSENSFQPAEFDNNAYSYPSEENYPVDTVSDINGGGEYENREYYGNENGYSDKQIKKIKKQEKKRSKKNKRLFKFTWLIFTIIAGIILGQFLVIGFNDMLAINRGSSEKVHIEIGPNPTLDEVASVLRENHVINNELFFKLYTNVTNSSDGFRQGSFDIETNMDYEEIVNYMQSNLNRTDIVTVQLYEGMNVLEIADKLEEEGVLTDRDKFFELLNSDIYDEDYPFLQNVSSEGKYYRLEGYLFPDTYDFYKNEDPETTIERFLSNYERRVIYTKYENENYEKDVTIEKMIEDSGYSMDEIMIIASIIQAEAADEEDMYYVSSVLHNRLNSDIDDGLARLDCDSTVYYPYRSKGAIPEDKGDYVSDYNTYSIYGLPAGSICNPSLAAIMAALYPYDTNYYYFCHSAATEDSPSVAYYATNADEHHQNLIAAGLVEE